EAQLRPVQDSPALHIDRIGAVDHDLADRVVAEQGLERAEADGFVDERLDEARGIGVPDDCGIARDDLLEDATQASPQPGRLEVANLVPAQVDLREQAPVEQAPRLEWRIIGRWARAGPGLRRGRAGTARRVRASRARLGRENSQEEAADDDLVALEQRPVL